MDKEAFRILAYVKNHRKVAVMGFTADFIWSIIFISIPFFVGVTIDKINLILIRKESTDFGSLYFYLAVVTSLIVGEYLIFVFIRAMAGKLAVNVTQDVRRDLFTTLQKQSHRYYDNSSTGDLVSRTTGDVNQTINFIFVMIYIGLLMIGEFAFTIAYLYYIDFLIAGIALLSIPIFAFTLKIIEKKYSQKSLEAKNSLGKLSHIMEEDIDMAKVSRIFGAEDKDYQRFTKENDNYLNIRYKTIRIQEFMNSQSNFIIVFVGTILLFVAGSKVISNDLTIGQLVTILLLVRYLSAPVNNATALLVYYGDFKAASKRIVAVLESIPEIDAPMNGVIIENGFIPKIAFENVNFKFHTAPILKNVNLSIQENQKVAILGATGSGKSSLINLIPRYYDSQEGTVRINGIDVKEYDLPSLRKAIGFVDQETYLFSRSIRENIAFGNPEATMDEIIRVAKIVQIHDYINELPDKYDTEVGERGVNLSGGQRQRLSIARTLLADPKIVVFDDSLSAVDTVTESQIQFEMEHLLEDRTVIFVTQRLSTTQFVDTNIIIHDGEIVEMGSHEELMEYNGIYARLFESQENDLFNLDVIKEVKI